MIKLEIQNKVYEIEDEVFERLITAAHTSLNNLRRKEGKMFPEIDRKAEQLALEIRSLRSML